MIRMQYTVTKVNRFRANNFELEDARSGGLPWLKVMKFSAIIATDRNLTTRDHILYIDKIIIISLSITKWTSCPLAALVPKLSCENYRIRKIWRSLCMADTGWNVPLSRGKQLMAVMKIMKLYTKIISLSSVRP